MEIEHGLSTPLFVRRTVTRCACFRTAMALPSSRHDGQGTGSHPPECQGHTSPTAPQSRKAFDRPVSAQRFDCVFTAGGVNRQVGILKGDTYVRYNSIQKMRTVAGARRTAFNTVMTREALGVSICSERSTHGSSLTDTIGSFW